MIHQLRATPATCFWGFFDAALPPVLRARSGDLVRIETLTHQAGDAPDLMMDPGVEAVYRAIPIAYPVFHPGALCYLGDPHMAEGDAELSGTAIEASAISVAGDFGVTQVVDQRQGVHGMIAKNLFVPPVSA